MNLREIDPQLIHTTAFRLVQSLQDANLLTPEIEKVIDEMPKDYHIFLIPVQINAENLKDYQYHHLFSQRWARSIPESDKKGRYHINEDSFEGIMNQGKKILSEILNIAPSPVNMPITIEMGEGVATMTITVFL